MSWTFFFYSLVLLFRGRLRSLQNFETKFALGKYLLWGQININIFNTCFDRTHRIRKTLIFVKICLLKVQLYWIFFFSLSFKLFVLVAQPMPVSFIWNFSPRGSDTLNFTLKYFSGIIYYSPNFLKIGCISFLYTWNDDYTMYLWLLLDKIFSEKLILNGC